MKYLEFCTSQSVTQAMLYHKPVFLSVEFYGLKRRSLVGIQKIMLVMLIRLELNIQRIVTKYDNCLSWQ